MKKSDINSSADLFLYKAIIDFNSAKILFNAIENEDVEIYIEKVYFDLQQSTEKLLKSLLTKNGIKFPKVKDLKKLIVECRNNEIALIENIH